MDETVQKCKEILQKHYGPQFQGLVLYGSYARNQAELSSDIDLLILLEQPFNYFQELKNIVELLPARSYATIDIVFLPGLSLTSPEKVFSTGLMAAKKPFILIESRLSSLYRPVINTTDDLNCLGEGRGSRKIFGLI